jgi:hypothetical protein
MSEFTARPGRWPRCKGLAQEAGLRQVSPFEDDAERDENEARELARECGYDEFSGEEN